MIKTFTFLGPFVILAIYIGSVFFIRGKIPDSQTLLGILQGLYAYVGYPLVFVGALFEATFLLGFYVPGTAVVLLGAALSKAGVVQFYLVYILGTLGFLLGFFINYILGRYGWYHVLAQLGFEKGIDEAKSKLEKHGNRALFLGYLYPVSASFLSTAAGVLRMPFWQFAKVSTVAQSLWGLLWGLLAYTFGMPLVEFILKYFVYVAIAIVGFLFLKRYVTKKSSKKAS